LFYITSSSFILFVLNRIIGLYSKLPFAKLVILDNGTNKKISDFVLINQAVLSVLLKWGDIVKVVVCLSAILFYR